MGSIRQFPKRRCRSNSFWQNLFPIKASDKRMSFDHSSFSPLALFVQLSSQLLFHHSFQFPGTEKQSIGMSGQFSEIPLLIKRFRPLVNAVEQHSNEGENLARLITVVQGLGQEQTAQPQAMRVLMDSQPGEHGDRQHPTRQPFSNLRR